MEGKDVGFYNDRDNTKRAAPIGAALVVALRHWEDEAVQAVTLIIYLRSGLLRRTSSQRREACP